MSWKRFRKKIRRLVSNLVIFVVLAAVFGGLGYIGYLFIKDPKQAKLTIAGWFGKGRRDNSTTDETPRDEPPPPPPDELAIGPWREPNGAPLPGVFHGRLDLGQFLRRGLLNVTGAFSSEEEPERIFDRKTNTYIRLRQDGPTQLVIEFKRPQVLTAVRVASASINNGTFAVECMEEPAVRTRPDVDERIHRVLAQDQPYESRRYKLAVFPRPVKTAVLRLTLDREFVDKPAFLAELELYGRITISSVRLAAESHRVQRFTELPVEVRVHDDNGLRIDPPGPIAWHSSRPAIAHYDEEGEAIKATGLGQAQIVADVCGAPSAPFDVLVYSRRPGPSGVSALAFRRSTYLQWEPPKTPDTVAYYLVYRRKPKTEFTRKPVGRARGPEFTDRTCASGQTYMYRVEAYNENDKLLGGSEPSEPVTTSTDAAHFTEVPSLDVLVLLYSKTFTENDLEMKRRGIDEAVKFYYRNSLGALYLDCTYWDIPTLPPITNDPHIDKRHDLPDENPGGDERPTMGYIAHDIETRGIENNEFDVIYATGRGLSGNWGGFMLLGAGGAFGASGGVPITVRDTWKANYGLTWIFCHEFQHALDFVVIGDQPFDMYGCHFYDNYPLGTRLPLDCGAHFDGIAQILRGYPRNDYSDLKEPYTQRVETLDADQDGLPDYDPRFPVDEERFGSNPELADTDGDGLGDLAEFCAGNFFGSDPNNPDTDGDGIPDGRDTYPLYYRADRIPYLPGGHTIDGVLEPSWSLYTQGFIFTKDDDTIKARIYANYDENNLYIAIESNKPRKWFIELDASGEDGRWESPYRFKDADPSDPNSSFGDVWAEGAAFVARPSKVQLTSKGKPVEGASIAVGTRNNKFRFGYGHVIEIALPRTLPPGAAPCYFTMSRPLTPGLFLEPGKVFGLNFYSNTDNDRADQYSGDWACVFEVFHFVDAVLTGADDLDGDGLNAQLEARRGTDPLDPDTDHDGIPDSRDPSPADTPKR